MKTFLLCSYILLYVYTLPSLIEAITFLYILYKIEQDYSYIGNKLFLLNRLIEDFFRISSRLTHLNEYGLLLDRHTSIFQTEFNKIAVNSGLFPFTFTFTYRKSTTRNVGIVKCFPQLRKFVM